MGFQNPGNKRVKLRIWNFAAPNAEVHPFFADSKGFVCILVGILKRTRINVVVLKKNLQQDLRYELNKRFLKKNIYRVFDNERHKLWAYCSDQNALLELKSGPFW